MGRVAPFCSLCAQRLDHRQSITPGIDVLQFRRAASTAGSEPLLAMLCSNFALRLDHRQSRFGGIVDVAGRECGTGGGRATLRRPRRGWNAMVSLRAEADLQHGLVEGLVDTSLRARLARGLT